MPLAITTRSAKLRERIQGSDVGDQMSGNRFQNGATFKLPFLLIPDTCFLVPDIWNADKFLRSHI